MKPTRIGRASISGDAVALIARGKTVRKLEDVAPQLPGVSSGTLNGLFADWPATQAVLIEADLEGAPSIEVAPDDFLAPLERPPHLICIGTNYRDHIEEMGIPALPQFPYGFLKPVTTICRPCGPVVLPSSCRMVDWEAELGVVIGVSARDRTLDNALGVVAGYLPLNDVSARDWIVDRPSLGIDWVMQKAHDGFNPLGPWITLAPGVPDPQDIPVQCLLNGALVQDSSTSNMVFTVAEIIVHLSAIMTLSPGDIIATGTPAGVGFGRKPQVFLKDGDVVTVALGDLGSFDTTFVAQEVRGHG